MTATDTKRAFNWWSFSVAYCPLLCQLRPKHLNEYQNIARYLSFKPMKAPLRCTRKFNCKANLYYIILLSLALTIQKKKAKKLVKSNGKCASWLASRKTILWPLSLVCYSEDGKRQVALHRSTIPQVAILNNGKKYIRNILPERVFRSFIGFFYFFFLFWLKVVVNFLLKEHT